MALRHHMECVNNGVAAYLLLVITEKFCNYLTNAYRLPPGVLQIESYQGNIYNAKVLERAVSLVFTPTTKAYRLIRIITILILAIVLLLTSENQQIPKSISYIAALPDEPNENTISWRINGQTFTAANATWQTKTNGCIFNSFYNFKLGDPLEKTFEHFDILSKHKGKAVFKKPYIVCNLEELPNYLENNYQITKFPPYVIIYLNFIEQIKVTPFNFSNVFQRVVSFRVFCSNKLIASLLIKQIQKNNFPSRLSVILQNRYVLLINNKPITLSHDESVICYLFACFDILKCNPEYGHLLAYLKEYEALNNAGKHPYVATLIKKISS